MTTASTLASPLSLLLLAGVMALGAALSSGEEVPPYKDPDRPVEERVRDLLARMTLEDLLQASQADIESISGFGGITSQSIHQGLAALQGTIASS